jgi:hypothetical protein
MMEMTFDNIDANRNNNKGIATKLRSEFIYYMANLNKIEVQIWKIYRKIEDVVDDTSKIQ